MKVPVSPVRPATFDWLGQIAALAGVGALIFGLIEGGVLGFGAAQVLASLAVAVLALAVFLLAQARGRSPMMPLDLFQSPGLRIALSVGFSFMVGWYGMVFVISLFLQQHLGLSPLVAGLVAMLLAAPAGSLVMVSLLLIPVGVAVFGALLAGPAGFVPGLQASLLIAALLLLSTAVASVFIRRIQN